MLSRWWQYLLLPVHFSNSAKNVYQRLVGYMVRVRGAIIIIIIAPLTLTRGRECNDYYCIPYPYHNNYYININVYGLILRRNRHVRQEKSTPGY